MNSVLRRTAGGHHSGRIEEKGNQTIQSNILWYSGEESYLSPYERRGR